MEYLAATWGKAVSLLNIPRTELLLLSLLIFGFLSFIIARIGALSPKGVGLKNYESLPVAWPSIVVLWALLALGGRNVANLIPFQPLQAFDAVVAADPQKALFVVYLIGFFSLWFVYFMSRSENMFFRTRTLRTMLGNTSLNWKGVLEWQTRPMTPEEIENFQEFEDIQQKKAQSSVQAVSILAAAAAVVISPSSEYRQSAIDKNQLDAWKEFMLLASLVSGIASFYCFVVAVDVLDTVFNRFFDDGRVKILTHLYSRSINPKYYGLVLLMGSLALHIAASQPLLGAVALAVAMFTGYSHWFPRVDPRVGLQKLEWVLRTFFLLLPGVFVFW